MDEDKHSLVEKILKDIDNVMSKNTDLVSFDIVPMEINCQNKSPVLHLENCLGLEAWCVKHVYLYCYSEIKEQYLFKSKRKVKFTPDAERLSKLLNITILLNPDVTILWNKRRELVLNQFLEKTSELQFTRMVLSRKPKCNDAYAYRRWLLDIILSDDNLTGDYIDHLAGDELFLCRLTVNNCPNNYHSWNHRMWIINRVKAFENKFDLSMLLIREYNFSQKLSANSVSDYSCYHYRQFCIKNIYGIKKEKWYLFRNLIDFNTRKCFMRTIGFNFPNSINIDAFPEAELLDILLCIAAKNCNCNVDKILFCRKFELLFLELALNDDLISCYPNHETLWYHRRFIVHEIMSIMYAYFGLVRENGKIYKHICKKCHPEHFREMKAKFGRYDGSSVYSCILFNILVKHEKDFIEEKRNKDNYADRHEKYLKFIEGLNIVI